MMNNWSGQILNMKKDALENKLEDIAHVMLSGDLTFAGGGGVGDDEFGAVLFFFYYSRFKQSEAALDAGVELVSGIFDRVNLQLEEGNIWVSSSYLNSVGWLLEHLEQNDFLEIDTNEVFSLLDEFVFQRMMADIAEENYDLVAGALGKALYFLARLPKQPEVARYLAELVDGLARISQTVPGRGIAWRHKIQDEEGNDVYVGNLGLAHGIPGIAFFLARCVNLGIAAEKARPLIEGAVQYIFSHQQDRKKFLSHFPQWIVGDSYASESRLAWCYGDLGVGSALLQTARFMNQSQWHERALDILSDTALRFDLYKNAVQDAGLCHGTAGIGHMFNRLFRYTGHEDFKTAARYWFEKTIEMSSFPDGIAGYKAFKGKGEWQGKLDLFLGVTGIGLAIMSALGDLEPAWDEILLLS